MMKRVLKDIGSTLMKYMSPIFLLMLILAIVMWYITKLSYTYTTQIPVDVRIEDNSFRVYCVVEGTGYRLFAHKYLLNNDVQLSLDEIEYAPSVKDKDYYAINILSFQNAISTLKGDIKVVSVEDLPEITINDQQE